ncbi:MAG: apolipoprotein N-acyltransferase, partial [Acidimicrobiia bacterium]
MRSLVAAVSAAGLLVFAFPPVGWGILAVAGLAVFMWALRRAPTVGMAALTGFVFGLVMLAGLMWWLAALGLIALVPLAVLHGLYTGAYGAGMGMARRWPDGGWWSAAVGGWALTEFVRARFPFGGLEWGAVGYPMGEYAAARAAAQWIGTSGWGVMVAAIAAGAVLAVTARRWRWLVGPVGLSLLLAWAGAMSPPFAEGDRARVVIVQGNTPCPGTHCPDERYLTYLNHLDLTRRLEPGSVDLVVWAEGSTGGLRADPVLVREVAETIGAEARRLGAVILTGGDRPLSDTHWVNANVVFGADGEIIDEYQKRHPVPFGEYIPARPLFDWIPALRQVPRDMIPGDEPTVFPVVFGVLGSVVSWEGSFARYARDVVKAGADLLVVATNNASYEVSPASDQLIGMTRMRSAELGIEVVHAAVTGRSTLITNAGVVGDKTPIYEEALLAGALETRDAPPTLYTRWGDWVQVAAFGLVALGAAVASRAPPGAGK